MSLEALFPDYAKKEQGKRRTSRYFCVKLVTTFCPLLNPELFSYCRSINKRLHIRAVELRVLCVLGASVAVLRHVQLPLLMATSPSANQLNYLP